LRAALPGDHDAGMNAPAKFLILLAALAAAPALAQDVRVTISGEVAPGVYGRVDIGTKSPPPLVQPTAVLIVKQARPPAPIYMHVPPGHARNWRKHCKRYNACGVPVYFVKSAEYEPGYRPPGKGKGRGQGRGRN
jgi:hypothetical protein